MRFVRNRMRKSRNALKHSHHISFGSFSFEICLSESRLFCCDCGVIFLPSRVKAMNAFLSVFNPDSILSDLFCTILGLFFTLLFDSNMHSTNFGFQLFYFSPLFRLLSIQPFVILRLLKAFFPLFTTTHPTNKASSNNELILW